MHAVLIDPDEYQLDLLSYSLRREGFQVHTAPTAQVALDHWDEWRPNIAVLEADLPDMDGFALCEHLRADAEVPVILLTARAAESEVIRGLDAGADDYIVKPFSARQLVSRMQAILRRYHSVGDAQSVAELRFGNQVLDMESHQVLVPAAEAGMAPHWVQLTCREFRILYLLVVNEGQVIPYSRLWELACDYWDEAGSYRLKPHISSLRRKLGMPVLGPGAIEAVPGVGYRLVPLTLRGLSPTTASTLAAVGAAAQAEQPVSGEARTWNVQPSLRRRSPRALRSCQLRQTVQ